MKLNTHLKINNDLCGTPIELREYYAKLELKTTQNMVVDESGLIHGGFVFGFADLCAMETINHPNVVLGAASCRFEKPVANGELLTAEGMLSEVDGKKQIVKVIVKREEDIVFTGEFVCFTPENHVLSNR